jgi:hypothetical protein
VSADLLVVPRRRGPRRAAPGVVVGDRAVGVVFADRPAQLAPFERARGRAGRDGIAVAAMGKDVYLDLASGWIAALRAAGCAVTDVRASIASRETLLDVLCAGPAVALYAGHGRTRGWAGYQTVRWEHVAERAQERPAGVVVALACDTLTRTRSAVPFGVRLVQEGRAAAYLGAAAPLRIPDGAALGTRLVEALASRAHADLASLLTAVARGAAREGDRPAARALRALRLVGDPRVALPR